MHTRVATVRPASGGSLLMHVTPLRVLLFSAATLVCVIPAPALADLAGARSFAVVSGEGHLGFGSLDTLLKFSNPTAATCPAGDGCRVFVGGMTVSEGKGNRIGATFTQHVGGADLGLHRFSSVLIGLSPVRRLPPIVLGSGMQTTLNFGSQLTVVRTDSIEIDAPVSARIERTHPAVPASPVDRCAKATNKPATLTLHAPATATIVFNIGSTQSPGTLVLCDGSVLKLDGGITPDRVVFNVIGKGGPVTIGTGVTIFGTMLAPDQTFFVEDGTPATNYPTTINGAVLAGGDVTIGNSTNVNFYPLDEIGTPAKVRLIGTVDVTKLPKPPRRTTTVESEDNPRQPRLEFPGRQPSKLTPSQPFAKQGVQKPHGAALGSNLASFVTFDGISQNGKVPPDVQFAAGATRLIEMVNVSGAMYTKTGTFVRAFDLGQFFLGNVGQGTDPRIYYDAPTGNFIAAYELHPAGGDDIRLAISSDPGTSWTVYDVAANNAGATYDQPKLGIGSDKIILSWNNYGSENGTSYIVIAKSGIVARAGSVPAWIWQDDTSRFQVVPANSMSPDQGTQYAGWRCCGMSNFDLMRFTGVPGVSPVNFSDSAYGIGGVSGPPAAAQPAGGDPSINTNDDRLLSTVWQYGNLWGNFNEGCTPQQDRSQRACERYVEIGTPSVGVRQNVQLQWTGRDIYYSAVTLDAGNVDRQDLFFGVTFSSATTFPSAMALGVAGAAFTPSTPAIIYQPGTRPYAGGGPLRWGDYCAAVRDPVDPSKVWVVNEFAAVTNPLGGWGTAITELHI